MYWNNEFKLYSFIILKKFHKVSQGLTDYQFMSDLVCIKISLKTNNVEI